MRKIFERVTNAVTRQFTPKAPIHERRERDDGPLNFVEVHSLGDLSKTEMDAAYALYEELFSGFASDIEDVEEIIEHPKAITLLIRENERAIGFVSGLPITEAAEFIDEDDLDEMLEYLPAPVRSMGKLAFRKAFFVTAFGISENKESSSIKTFMRTYEEFLQRLVDAGYTSIYAMARKKMNEQGRSSMSDHLQRIAKAQKIYTIEDFVPGEDFDVLRIPSIDTLLNRLQRR